MKQICHIIASSESASMIL